MVPLAATSTAVNGATETHAQGSITRSTSPSGTSSGETNNSWFSAKMNLLRLGSSYKKRSNSSYQEQAHADDYGEHEKSPKDNAILHHCRCCGSLVKIPESVTKYKCSICHSTCTLIEIKNSTPSPLPHDSSNKAVEMPHLEVISYRSIRRMIKQCERGSKDTNPHITYKPLEEYLAKCFGSFDILNNSFNIKRTDHISYSSPNINLSEVNDSYKLILSLPTVRPFMKLLASAQYLLSRPTKSLSKPGDLKWLLILWEIPTLSQCLYHHKRANTRLDRPEIKTLSFDIIKRIIGYLSNSDSSSLKYMRSWFTHSQSLEYFSGKVELINLYITFHLTRLINVYYNNSTRSNEKPSYGPSSRVPGSPNSPGYSDYTNSVKLNGSSQRSPSRVETTGAGSRRPSSSGHTTTGSSMNNNFLLPLTFQSGLISSWSEASKPAAVTSNDEKPFDFRLKSDHYGNEWHIKTAARLLSVFFVSNLDKLPIYSFYNTLVDYVNVKQDFEIWQNMFKSKSKSDLLMLDLSGFTIDRRPSLTFCQFPFLLSLGAKISILEYEAKKTMERKAEEAFIKALDKKKAMDVHLRIDVRRTHISNDSLRCIKEHAGELKKALKVHFIGEPGVDVGGLKKEWFSLLTSEIFSQENGMFQYNEESRLCWFATMPLERNDELYYMVGVVLGLAIYNSTILDLSFPLALYKKLLDKKVGLEDYTELYPQTGKGLSTLLTTNEDVSEYELYFETTYSDLLGNPVTKELIPNGAKIHVNQLNRHEYVKQWVDFYMNRIIKAQFNSFHKGFHNVIGGNALSLFAPKEIEMIICGNNINDSQLDVDSFRSITKYNGWSSQEDAKSSRLVLWFWEWFSQLSHIDHKKFLQFVTGSDRIPATGVHTMQFKISKMPSYGSTKVIRLPIAHTCFNELCLYEYRTKEEMFHKLDWAISESKGFGLR